MRFGVSFLLFFSLGSSLFAADSSPLRGEHNLWQTAIMIGVALIFFYFILWRPEKKRRKKMEEQRKQLSKGDRVTAMGMIGTVSKVDEESVTLKMVDGNRIEVWKSAITRVESSLGRPAE